MSSIAQPQLADVAQRFTIADLTPTGPSTTGTELITLTPPQLPAAALETPTIGLLPERCHRRVDSHVGVADSMHDAEGAPLRELTDANVTRLVEAFLRLPADEQRSLAPELLKLYFKNERPRLPPDSNQTSRKLYRALRDGAPVANNQQA